MAGPAERRLQGEAAWLDVLFLGGVAGGRRPKEQMSWAGPGKAEKVVELEQQRSWSAWKGAEREKVG